jgi:bifunctional non-homologous end joining protein LigD
MDTLLPMLAVRGRPFDSSEHLFEVKWNGVRALAASAAGRWRLWGREQADYTARYPELDVMRRLPPDTVVDGEIVLLPHGLPDLDALLARHQLTHPEKIRRASHDRPVSYVLFDVLQAQGQCLLAWPLAKRREVLQRLVAELAEPRVVFSRGVVGTGREFFLEAVRQGQEGIMAKHLASPYRPGRRSASWRKIKPERLLPCVIIGFEPGREGFRGLVVASPWEGRLRSVACLRVGFTNAQRLELQRLLAARVQSQPVLPCGRGVIPVAPELYCQVRYLEWTKAGRLRGASFHRLIATNSTALSKVPIGSSR